MNAANFIDRLRETLPPPKDLNSTQWTVYREKLARFTDDQRDKLFDLVVETSKRFPTIAEIYDLSRKAGFPDRADPKPERLTQTDCRICGGSGLAAAFWTQEFEIDEGCKIQVLRLHYLYPYHESGEYTRDRSHSDIRSVYRCSCPRGEAVTERGLPRWRDDMPQTMRREWGR